MALSPSLSPLYLSPVPSSVPQCNQEPRGRRTSSRKKNLLDEQVLSSSIIMTRALTPCSLKEMEIESSIYFPTFASRRKSSPQRHEKHSPGVTQQDTKQSQSPQHHNDIFQDDDDIFALDDCDEEEQEEMMDEDDEAQLTADIPSLDLDAMTISKSTQRRRRRSQQTNSSTISDQDLQMVWEEDDDEEEGEGMEEASQINDTVIIRESSTSSSSAACRSLVRRESLVASRKPLIKSAQSSILPSLTFARRIERPLEIAIGNDNNGSSPIYSHHWQKPRRGSSSWQKTPKRSSTMTVARPIITSRTASLERYQVFPKTPLNEKSATNETVEPIISIHSNTFPYLTPSSSKNKSEITSPSMILFGGRKRSKTDPIAVHPPFQIK